MPKGFFTYEEIKKHRVEIDGRLKQDFILPPFSVLDARQGYWQERKRLWIALGIKGEEGRDSDIVPNSSRRPLEHDGVWKRGFGSGSRRRNPGRSNGQDLMKGENPKFGKKMGGNPPYSNGHEKELIKAKAVKSQSRQTALQKTGDSKAIGTLGMSRSSMELAGGYFNEDGTPKLTSGTSVFDPVLCELIYKWFCLPGGTILDPFAGGSTRGIVANYLGLKYTGVELRGEQVEANELQAGKIGLEPKWIEGDCLEVMKLFPVGLQFDLIFSCPPYYDLEIYSESEKDGSVFETYERFMRWYSQVFELTVKHLKEDRFFVVVLGEIRDKQGVYRNFIGDSISAFIELGLNYYNEIILVTAIGSLPVRVQKAFTKNRKIGKTHQNVLVFFKGDVRRIRDIYPTDLQSF